LHAELFGATYVSHAFDAQHTPLELLLGPKYQHQAWWLAAAAGPGLVDGYGSPDFRVLASVGFAPAPRRRPTAEQTTAPSMDTDADGISDDVDRCPTEPEDRDGVDDADGCPGPDPGAAPAAAAPVLETCQPASNGELPAGAVGCPDRDRDRIGDATDRCPDHPGPASAQGCPRIEPPAQREIDVEFGHVEFGPARAVHAASSLPTLRAVQSILTVNTHISRTRVEGHADDTKDASKNLELSQLRARAIARWLVAHEIAATRLELVACGDRYPIATEPTASARQKNRRVEFYVVDPAPREPLAHSDCEPLELR
jgi:outer membrane protein OmpA-like peptidoglycan-associated protein